jgi:hypothetical protein
MTEADAEEVSALIDRSYDRVLVHYHSPELIAHFREQLIEVADSLKAYGDVNRPAPWGGGQ